MPPVPRPVEWPTAPPLAPAWASPVSTDWANPSADLRAPGRSTASGATRRVDGVDVARAVAMVGMVVAHYMDRSSEPGARAQTLDAARAFVDGRAMPLFVVLGGVSVGLLVHRARRPDRALLVRAALFLPLGLLLQQWTVHLAIVLQYYALFFVVAIVLRRLPTAVLLGLSAAAVAAGAWTFQVWGDLAPGDGRWEGWTTVQEPWRVLAALAIDGYYPLLPSIAFFGIGMWLGRRLARGPVGAPLVAGLVAGGTGAAVVGYLGGRWLTSLTDAAVHFAQPGEIRPFFSWYRLLDTAGHSQMPAWMLGSTGVALAVIGLCLAIVPRLGRLATPLVVAGQGALTFYVVQALVIRWTPDVETTTIGTEALIALGIVGSFVGLAALWHLRFRRLPLEALLHRLTAGPEARGRQDRTGEPTGDVGRRVTRHGSAVPHR